MNDISVISLLWMVFTWKNHVNIIAFLYQCSRDFVYYSVFILYFLREVFFPRKCKQKLGSRCCPGYEETKSEICSRAAIMLSYWLPYFCYYLILCYEMFQLICGDKSQRLLNSTNIDWTPCLLDFVPGAVNAGVCKQIRQLVGWW